MKRFADYALKVYFFAILAFAAYRFTRPKAKTIDAKLSSLSNVYKDPSTPPAEAPVEKNETAPAAQFVRRPGAAPMPLNDQKTWGPGEYSVVPSPKGIVAIQKNSGTLYMGAFEAVAFSCDRNVPKAQATHLCTKFPNGQVVELNRELYKMLPPRERFTFSAGNPERDATGHLHKQ